MSNHADSEPAMRVDTHPDDEAKRAVLFDLMLVLIRQGQDRFSVTTAAVREAVKLKPRFPDEAQEVSQLYADAVVIVHDEKDGQGLQEGNSVYSVYSVQGDGDWKPPIPFHDFDPPRFPTEALPGWLKDKAEAVATSTQTPPDLAGLLGICTCSASVAKSAVVKAKEGYLEPLNLWGGCGGQTGRAEERGLLHHDGTR